MSMLLFFILLQFVVTKKEQQSIQYIKKIRIKC